MWTRRQFLTRGTLGLLGATGTALAFQGDAVREAMPDGSQARDMVKPQTENAIEHGLEYLAQLQGQDGTWGTGGYSANVAITSLAALAFMAGGHLPGRGKYGEHVRKALRFVVSRGQQPAGGLGVFGLRAPKGFLHNTGHFGGQQGPMYSHGFGTLLLGEACGMVPDVPLRDDLRKVLADAVKVIVSAQSNEGGWRYNPQPFDADISVTVCQMMALRSAKNAGIDVPKSVADRCKKYVVNCHQGDGSFVYQLGNRGGFFGGPGGGFARTAAGVAALYSAGMYSGLQVEQGLRYLANNRPRRFGRQPADMHYFYGHYYAVQAMWTAGGNYWSDWYPAVAEELVQNQERNGSWSDMICSHYGTAMACIILQVPNNYLPILQK
jgi:hypothetical protein